MRNPVLIAKEFASTFDYRFAVEKQNAEHETDKNEELEELKFEIKFR